MPSSFLLSVCPHDTAKNLVGWFTLNTYVQRRLGTGIHFEPQDSFLVERQRVLDIPHHLVYANPFSALLFARERGFTPIARPIGVFDEAVLIAKVGATVPPNPTVASATDKLVIHSLGLTLLKQQGVDPGRFLFAGNHLNAAKAVIRGEADLGFVFTETWTGMAESTRSELRVVAETSQGQAFHCFMVSPHWADKREQLQQILCGMTSEEAGVKILKELRFNGFEAIGAEALEGLAQLLEVGA